MVLAFVDSVIPNKRFLVVGESYGGYLARGLTHYKVEMIDGMFLLFPVVKAPSANRKLPERTIIHSEDEYVRPLSPELQQALSQVAVVHTREVDDQLMEDYISAIQISDQTFLKRIRERYAFSFDLNESPVPFEFPALIITGRQDNIVGYEDQFTILHTVFPRGTLAVLDRSGNVSELEQPVLFTALVNDWFDRVEEYLNMSTDHE